MAFGFELDFRSAPAGAATDAPAKSPATSEPGEDFAAFLSRMKTPGTPDDPADASLQVPVALTTPLLPGTGPADTGPIPAAAATTNPDAIASDTPGELEIDREISFAHAAELQTGRPADVLTAPSARLNAAIQAASEASGASARAEQAPVPQSDHTQTGPQRSDVTVAAKSTEVTPAAYAPPPDEMALVSAMVAPAAAAKGLALNEGKTEPSAAVPASARSAGAQKGSDLSTLLAAEPLPPEEVRDNRIVTALAAFSDKAPRADAPASTQASASPLALAAATPLAPAPVMPAPASVAPAPVMLVAAPVEIADIVTRTASDGQSDRVVVQLDPPELGRVSIDFKFDAQGLQHVTITSETPEAMRQLRAMHSELVQALERQGLDSQNMTFQHQQQGSQQAASAALLRQMQSAQAGIATAAPAASPIPANGPVRADGRLDIRL